MAPSERDQVVAPVTRPGRGLKHVGLRQFNSSFMRRSGHTTGARIETEIELSEKQIYARRSGHTTGARIETS